MNRRMDIAAIAVGLAAYGIYMASYVPPLLIDARAPLILICFIFQAVAAVLAAVGVWRASSWAPVAAVLLGVAIAITEIVEGFVMGLISYDHALLVAIVGLVITFAIALYVRGKTVRV